MEITVFAGVLHQSGLFYTDIQLYAWIYILHIHMTEYFHIHELHNNKCVYCCNNRQQKKTTTKRDLNNTKGIDLSLHTQPNIRAPVLYAYLPIPHTHTHTHHITFVILNACVFHSQWKHSKYYAVCWIFQPFFFFFHFVLSFFLLLFIFDCVCVFWCIFITSKYIWNCLLSYIQNTQSYTYKIEMYKWRGFHTESLACIRFTSWKIKNNLFTVICMYCVCVYIFSLLSSPFDVYSMLCVWETAAVWGCGGDKQAGCRSGQYLHP